MTTKTTRRIAGLALTLVLLALGSGTARADWTVLSDGHTDALDVHWEEGELRVHVKDDTVEPSVRREPDEVIFHAAPDSELTIPEGLPPSYSFLGQPGDSVWILPEVQQDGILWPGWETHGVAGGLFADDALTFRLLSVDGPGAFNMFLTDPLGEAIPLLVPSQGLSALTTHALTHAHASWAFGAEGLYALTFEVEGTLADSGRRVRSGPVLYHFFVGDLAGLPELPQTTLSITGLQPEYAAGDTISLAAAQEPATGLDHYHWFARCGDAAELTFVPGEEELSFPATVQQDGCEYVVVLYGEGHHPLAISRPVTLNVKSGEPRQSEPEQPGQLSRPAPIAGDPPSRPVAPIALTARLSSARLRGRRLTLGLRVNADSRVRVLVRKGRRTIARGAPRTLRSGRRTLIVKLGRALDPGRYQLRVRITSGPRTLTRTIPLRVG